MQLFFSDQISSDSAVLTAEEARHCSKVLRHQVGDQIHITDGKGTLWEAVITEADKREVTATLGRPVPEYGEHAFRIHLIFSPLRLKDRLEWIIEKAVELGATDLFPVQCARTDKYKASFKPDRLNGILLTATKQCLRSRIPTLHPYQPLRDYFSERQSTDGVCMIARSDAKDSIPDLHSPLSKADTISLLIGPEGDFTDEEYEAAQQKGFHAVHLGQQRLRSETAAILGLGAIKLLKGF